MWGIQTDYGRIREYSVIVTDVSHEGKFAGSNPTNRVAFKIYVTCDLMMDVGLWLAGRPKEKNIFLLFGIIFIWKIDFAKCLLPLGKHSAKKFCWKN